MALEGKTALVTGGSRGIGRAVALELGRMGAGVALVYAGNKKAADETLALLGQAGVPCAAYPCNVADYAAAGQVAARAEAELGPVEVLVNNAGITRDALVLNMAEEDFDEVLAVNLKGAYNMMRHLYRPFMRRRSGRIINISSVVGLGGNAGQANYAASKAGLIGLTKSVAKELAGRGVTCNAVAPGFIQSDMTAALAEKVREGLLASIPMARFGHPEDVAGAVGFLASPAAAYITGQVLVVDGGMHM